MHSIDVTKLFATLVLHILLLFFVILVTKLFIMSVVHSEHSLGCEHPAIELDMMNFMEHLSDECVLGKVDVCDDDVRTDAKLIDCKTEDCTDFDDVSSISGSELKRENEVSEQPIQNLFCFYEKFW